MYQVTEQHGRFLEATGRLFDAIDRGDTAAALRIDADETDPVFGVMEAAVLDAAAGKHDRALMALQELQDLESVTRVLTPVVFLAGLLLAGLLASITRGHRRLLVIERERAVHDAHHDALTGLPNRLLFAQRIEQALVECAGTEAGVALLLVDLDRFKEINDTFGHQCGDELLVQVGARLSSVVSGMDSVARLGGDEFGVLLPEVQSVEDAVETATTLRAALTHPFPWTASTSTWRPAWVWRSPASTARTPSPCCSVPTSRCTSPRIRAGGSSSTTRPRISTAPRSSRCSATCAAPWTAASWCCTTSPRSASARVTSSAPRPWCAGTARSTAS